MHEMVRGELLNETIGACREYRQLPFVLLGAHLMLNPFGLLL
jgi:hypothetical protein